MLRKLKHKHQLCLVLCGQFCMSSLYTPPYKYITVCTFCRHQHIRTLQVTWIKHQPMKERCMWWLEASSVNCQAHCRGFPFISESKGEISDSKMCAVGLEIVHWAYLLSIVCKAPQKACEQTLPLSFYREGTTSAEKRGRSQSYGEQTKVLIEKREVTKGRSSVFSLWNDAVIRGYGVFQRWALIKKRGFQSGYHHFHTPIVNGNLILPDKGNIYSREHLQTTVFPRIYFPFFPVHFHEKWATRRAELYYSPYWTLGSLSCSSQTGPNSQNTKEDAFSFHKSLNLGLDDFCKHSFLHRFLWGLGKLIWLLLQCARHRFVFTPQRRVICL